MERADKFKFDKLIVWQKAMELGESINQLADKFPKKEMFNLSSQICRAVDSIALNIAEGSIRQSAPEFRKFTGYAIRSLAETATCLHKAKNRNYISDDEFHTYYDASFHLMNQLTAFQNKII
ncbi:MAG: four helix bundle protein [Bacteroidetes bacterium]|nr:four helix bundle protein [Bacteroidota bacterium]